MLSGVEVKLNQILYLLVFILYADLFIIFLGILFIILPMAILLYEFSKNISVFKKEKKMKIRIYRFLRMMLKGIFQIGKILGQ